MIDYRGMRRTVKPMLVNILKVEKQLNEEFRYDLGLEQEANTQEKLEKEMAEDTINELEEEMDSFAENAQYDRQGKA